MVPKERRSKFEPAWECIGATYTHAKYGTAEIWTEDGKLTSEITGLVLDDESAQTASGARVGMSTKSLKKLYPTIAGPYEGWLYDWSGVTYYRVDEESAAEKRLSLYFEVQDEKVSAITLNPRDDRDGLYTVTDRICGGE